jgi:serine/threonine-protein kinase
MAPEQLLGHALNRRVDIFAAGIVLWEALTCERLFSGDTEGETIKRVLEQVVKPPSATNPTVTPEVDAIVLRALERDPAKRYATALEMAIALEDAVPLATPRKVGEWVHDTVQDRLVQRASKVAVVESSVPNLTEVSEPTPPAFASSATPTVAAVVPARVEPLPKRSSVPVVLLLFGVIAIVGGLGWFYMRGRGTTATVGGAQTATGPAVSIGSAISSAASAALAAGTASATATTSTTTTGPAPTTTTKAAGTGAGTGTGTGTGTSATAKVGAKAGGKVGPKASASADIYSRD